MNPDKPQTPREELEVRLTALLMGTGYRGILEQLSAGDRARVIAGVVHAHLTAGTRDVRTDVIYATCRKDSP